MPDTKAPGGRCCPELRQRPSQHGSTRSPTWLVLLLAIVLTSCGTEVKVATPAPAEYVSGLSYSNYFVPEVPWSINVVRVNRSSHDLEFHTSHARNGALGLSTLSDQIKSLRPGLGTPLAGVNGDFYIRERAYTGDPRGLQIREGELLSAPIGGVSFWIDVEGRPHASEVISLFQVTWPNGATTPFGLNEERRTNKLMVLYTPSLGASTHTTNGLELVLEPEGESPWLPLRIGTAYAARVREVRKVPNTPLHTNTMVLSIAPAVLRRLPAIEVGTVLRLSTESSPDLRGVQTAIGGGPLLAHSGQRQPLRKPAGDGLMPYAVRSMKERHPRTALGWDDQFFYLVEVDGRQKQLSTGMTLNELADFMIRMGCKEAINFDGGGSAMIWCNGRIVNSPCDRKERDIANALLVVRRPGGPGATAGSAFEGVSRSAP